MKNENTKIKQPSEKCKKLTPNSVCYKKNLLCINDNELYGEERKHVKNYNNKDVSGILSFYLFNFNLFLTYEYVVIIFIKLITIYFFFISPFVLIMADEVHNSLTISGSPSGDLPSPSNALGTSDLQSGFTTKLTQLCKTYFPNSPICQSPEVMGMLGFFIFSTVISLIFGIFRRCIFRCKTCCIYGTRSSRRKRMEEERQENEMFEKQMSSLQMRKNLLTKQQKSLQALMQGAQAQGKDKKKKKKSSKKGPENSMNNAIQLSYRSPPQ
ncbi:hypothetical protein, conserved [Plasmodium vivax]|uniref:Uncharacterized protein n=1 Tax=Plasmodium vivax TaxID=5855 RepID=A0A1G4HCI9_PLAVI|nr:hypothetical protein, conserved [Plasmodium vivax]